MMVADHEDVTIKLSPFADRVIKTVQTPGETDEQWRANNQAAIEELWDRICNENAFLQRFCTTCNGPVRGTCACSKKKFFDKMTFPRFIESLS